MDTHPPLSHTHTHIWPISKWSKIIPKWGTGIKCWSSPLSPLPVATFVSLVSYSIMFEMVVVCYGSSSTSHGNCAGHGRDPPMLPLRKLPDDDTIRRIPAKKNWDLWTASAFYLLVIDLRSHGFYGTVHRWCTPILRWPFGDILGVPPFTDLRTATIFLATNQQRKTIFFTIWSIKWKGIHMDSCAHGVHL